MLAEVPERIIDIGTWAGVIVAVIGAARTAPGRWLWRRLVERPVGEWLDGKHAQAIAPVVDRLDSQGERLAGFDGRLTAHLAEEEAAGKITADRLVAGDKRMDRIEGKLDRTLAALAGGNVEVRPSLIPPGPKNVWGGQ